MLGRRQGARHESVFSFGFGVHGRFYHEKPSPRPRQRCRGGDELAGIDSRWYNRAFANSWYKSDSEGRALLRVAISSAGGPENGSRRYLYHELAKSRFCRLVSGRDLLDDNPVAWQSWDHPSNDPSQRTRWRQSPLTPASSEETGLTQKTAFRWDLGVSAELGQT